MEITESVHTQIVFPGLIVSFVLVFAVLVFVFGFKSVEDFPFDKLATNDNRKPAGKKRKAKDKKAQPGQISSVAEPKHKNVDGDNKHVSNTSKSKNVEKAPAKEPLKANVRQDKKQSTVEQSVSTNHNTALKESKTNRVVEKHIKTQHKDKENKEKPNKNVTATKKTQNKGKENINVQNKKNQVQPKNKVDEKQNDDDGGEWEQAFSRKDKKIKKSPLIEEEPVDKLIKPDPTGAGKKKKVGNQNESANVPVESEPQVTPAPAPVPVAAPEPQDQEVVTKVVAAKIKNKEQKKETQKSLKEVTNNKIVNSSKVEEEEQSKPKEKHTPKVHVESMEFIENEKQSTADVISPELKPIKETHDKDLNADTTPIFDELGDSWKEAKAAKKQSKKKVRKAE